MTQAAILHQSHDPISNTPIRIVRRDDQDILVEAQYLDSLGNETWIAIRHPQHDRQRIAWFAMLRGLSDMYDTLESLK